MILILPVHSLRQETLFDKRAIVVAKALGVNVITAGVILEGLIIRGIVMNDEVLSVFWNTCSTLLFYAVPLSQYFARSRNNSIFSSIDTQDIFA